MDLAPFKLQGHVGIQALPILKIRKLTRGGGPAVLSFSLPYALVAKSLSRSSESICSFRNRIGPARPSAAGRTRPPGLSRPFHRAGWAGIQSRSRPVYSLYTARAVYQPSVPARQPISAAICGACVPADCIRSLARQTRTVAGRCYSESDAATQATP